jgi:hypothetical protein
VRDGRLDLPISVIYEMPEALHATDDWRDPVWWPRLNPNFGCSVDETFLDRVGQDADGLDPQASRYRAASEKQVQAAAAEAIAERDCDGWGDDLIPPPLASKRT